MMEKITRVIIIGYPDEYRVDRFRVDPNGV